MRSYLAFLFVVAACVADRGPEEALPDDGKADTQRKPTDHGAIAFGTPAVSELTAAARYHAWTFDVFGDAHLSMTTSYAVKGQRRTDTVLYLYKQTATGWGSYIARNDNYSSTTYSQLIRDLGPGHYRVLVKGYSESTYGKFKLTVGCSGPGCEAPACLFGTTYHEMFDQPTLQIIGTQVFTADTIDTLSAEDRQHIVDAVKQSAWNDVTTPEEAISHCDQQEINITWVVEPDAQRRFTAFEYGAGDNSYGAIFDRADLSMAAAIHDGDLYSCTRKHETCLLSNDWVALRNDPSFTQTSARVITSASQVTGVESQQVLATLQHTYGADIKTIAQGLELADGHELNIITFTHTSGAKIVVNEHGAGDTSVGVIYYAGELRRAGTIEDLSITDCTLFAN